MGTLQITTLKGQFTIDADQLVGVERVQVNTPDGPVDGTRILIHIGVIARHPDNPDGHLVITSSTKADLQAVLDRADL